VCIKHRQGCQLAHVTNLKEGELPVHEGVCLALPRAFIGKLSFKINQDGAGAI
jgi:hypothetical protein